MKSRIKYFMAKDTRLIDGNLTKVIVNENIVLVNYTVQKRSLKDEKETVVRYLRNKNRILIYGILKKYNPIVYEGFIDWAENKGIEWHSIGNEKEQIKELENER